MRISWKWVAANCAVMIAVAATVAVAASPGGSNGQSGTKAKRSSFEVHRADGGHDLSALAKELGVSETKLRDALDKVHTKLGPPKLGPPGGFDRPSRANLEKRCNELTDALATELGKNGDEVRAAIKAVLKAGIQDAVDAKRLTQSQADKMLERIDSEKCLPPMGPPGHIGFGCAHGPGPRNGADNGDTELPAPPPGERFLVGPPPA